MSGGLDTTFELLAKTLNRAADDVLIASMDLPVAALADQGVHSLVERNSEKGNRELVRKWKNLSESAIRILADHSKHFTPSVLQSILSSDEALKNNGYEIAVSIELFTLIPDLIQLAEDRGYSRQSQAARTVRELAELMKGHLHKPRDFRATDCIHLIHEQSIECLAESLKRFKAHGRQELVDAFLVLVTHKSSTFRLMLQDKHLPCHDALVSALAESQQDEIIDTLVVFFEDQHPPALIVDIWNRRSDWEFIARLADVVGAKPTERVQINLKRLKKLNWLPRDWSILLDLSGCQQAGIASIAESSSISREQSFEIVKYLLQNGAIEARRCAAELLANYKTEQGNRLALETLQQEDPHVKASIVRQLKSRAMPGATALLLNAVNSPHEVVQKAVQQSFDEVNIDRYLASFDMLTPEVRRSTGALVRKIDTSSNDRIINELKSTTRTRRMRGLSVVETLEIVEDLEEHVIECLKDNDHFVRAEAAGVLGLSNTKQARMVLRDALMDTSVAVQEAAELSLQQLASLSEGESSFNSHDTPS